MTDKKKVHPKPLISGGRTLSKAYQGKKPSGGGKQQHRRKVWYEDGGVKFGTPYKGRSYPVGETPPDVVSLKPVATKEKE